MNEITANDVDSDIGSSVRVRPDGTGNYSLRIHTSGLNISMTITGDDLIRLASITFMGQQQTAAAWRYFKRHTWLFRVRASGYDDLWNPSRGHWRPSDPPWTLGRLLCDEWSQELPPAEAEAQFPGSTRA